MLAHHEAAAAHSCNFAVMPVHLVLTMKIFPTAVDASLSFSTAVYFSLPLTFTRYTIASETWPAPSSRTNSGARCENFVKYAEVSGKAISGNNNENMMI